MSFLKKYYISPEERIFISGCGEKVIIEQVYRSPLHQFLICKTPMWLKWIWQDDGYPIHRIKELQFPERNNGCFVQFIKAERG